MKLAFTICANNYLAHAKTLAVSFKKHHPDVTFCIAILDEPNASINYESLGADTILWIHELFPELVAGIKDTYNIAEICTVVKPKLFTHFFNNSYNTVLYVDPDIKVFSAFTHVFDALKENEMVLTPHICSPTGETGHPQDKDLMRTGIYNLGFLAVNNTEPIKSFIKWWDKRVQAYGFHDLKKGYFYDQIWLGYAPAFLDKVYVLRHLGYNVANWNLHERKIISSGEKYYVNDKTTPVAFFHYSHYKIENFPSIAVYNQNFDLENREDIVPIFMDYKNSLLQNDYEKLKEIPYKFGKRKVDASKNSKELRANKGRIYKSFQLLKKSLRMALKGC
ncbi:hypothetical protein DFR65_1143 [Oceanihabitans sediminis]|uniref:Glycosyl transferase n=1 Tax=Oceanihabitans sediminis TaxID=1812012 RepID=A0A368P3T1_9FLAO|nr:hypothetical protein [Oceanihabitans sediminis]RBP26596.1 hypothetical protein DFR65_1143 [Oceanihabitans sediminis]RCU57113.1 hypothetical protein DU428_09215 [Oceanihabitans sediminis]